MNYKNPAIDAILDEATSWKTEMRELRSIALDLPLVEELKWGWPCYTFQGTNVVLIHAFKHYCALLFIKGALLRDPHGILIQQTKNVQAGRQVRFTGLQEIVNLKAVLHSYIQQAIELEKAGAKVAFKGVEQFAMAEEFQARLSHDPVLKQAFESLTPGRQKAYLLHFSSARQSKTREARIEKCVGLILNGKGLNDV